MAKIQLVVEIDELIYKFIKAHKKEKPFGWLSTKTLVTNAIINGTPLPKGHGDLIDRNDYDKRLESIWKFYHGDETIHDTVDDFDLRFADGVSRAREALNDEPTIIEADKEG